MLSLIGRNGQGIGSSVLAEWANKVLSLDLPPAEKVVIDKLIDNIYDSVEKRKYPLASDLKEQIIKEFFS